MADENVITRFSTLGKSQTIADFAAVQAAENNLLTVIESSGVRQRQVYDSVARAAEQLAARQEAVAKAVQSANEKIAESQRLVIASGGSGRSFEARQQGVQAAIQRGALEGQNAVLQAGTAHLRAMDKALEELASQYVTTTTEAQKSATAITAAADRQAQAIQRNTQLQTQFNEALRAQQARLNVVGERTTPLQNNIGGFTGIGNVAGSATTKLIQEQQQRLEGLRQSVRGVAGETQLLEKANLRKTESIKSQTSAEEHAQKKGITYLSTLSAIHAATFLLGGQTFSNVGSLTVLGAAFGKVSLGASAAGVALGLALLGVQTFTNLAEQTKQRLDQLLISLLGVTGAITGIGAAFAKSGVEIAASVETPLALLRALGGATVEQTVLTEKNIGELALAYGRSAKDVAEAGNLFVFAGGKIEDANSGAVKSILELQAASGGTLSLADAARLVAVTMNQFNLTGADTARIVSVITAAVQNSALSFTTFAQGFQQATPGAVTFGLTLEEVAAVVGALGNELQGTVAGTAFKQFMLDLTDPTPKAIAALQGIGLNAKFAFDELGEGRPAVDIVKDLSTALAGVSTQQRSEALAQIFESRAGLAGNILARPDIVENLNKIFDAIDRTASVDVAARVLATLNAQLQRLGVSTEEVRRAFGGPLLGTLTSSAKSAADFIGGLTDQARLAGEMVGVVLAGEGFGALQQRIQDVTGDPALSTFFTRLVELGLQARSIIMDQLVPAIGAFVDAVGGIANEEGRVADINERFDQAAGVLAKLGAQATLLISKLAGLVQEFVNNEGAGGRFRQLIVTIGDAIINNAVQALIRLPVVIAAGLAAFTLMAKGAGLLTKAFIQLGSTVAAVLTDIGTRIRGVQEGAFAFGAVAAALSKVGTAIAEVQRDVTKVGELKDAVDNLFSVLGQPIPPQSNPFLDVGKSIQQGVDAAQALLDAQEEIERGLADISKTAQSTIGELPAMLDNVSKELEEVGRDAVPRREGGAAGGGTGVIDPALIKKAQDQVTELGQDLARRLTNLNEDVANRNAQIVENALERIGDIFDTAQRRIDETRDEANKREAELITDQAQRRSDRSRVQDLQDTLDEEARLNSRFFEQLGTQDARFREDIRQDRARDSEDVERQYQRQADVAERAYKQQVDAAERAFKEIQDAQERALTAQQKKESDALARQLEDQAEARRVQLELASAKTPADRQRIQQQAAASAADRAFARGQQLQTDALAKRHDDQRRALDKQAEAQQLAFKRQQEVADLAFREQQELAALRRRRTNEDRERDIRRQEEDQDFVTKVQREEVLRQFREQQEKRMQALRDKLEDEALERSILRIRAEQRLREEGIEADAGRRADELITDVDRQIAANVVQAIRGVRSVNDTLQDKIEDFAKSVGTTAIPGLAELVARTRGQAGVVVGQAGDAANQARQALRDVVTQQQTALAERVAQQPTTVQQPLRTDQLVVTAVLPPTLATAIEAAFITGLTVARQQGILPTQQINITTGATPQEIIDLLREQFTPGITRR